MARKPPPGTWAPARGALQTVLSPIQRLGLRDTASGILLLVAAAVAMAWANSPWRESYQSLLHSPIGLRAGGWVFERELEFWINDGLMAIFFFVAGLEIRRELHSGELSDARRAALPFAAALGGMIAPALIFAALNAGRPTADGWGIPMATDIAFAVGVLTLLDPRTNSPLRILLLSLAVIDDLGAILVIAVFYSSGLDVVGLAVMGGGILGLVVLQASGVRIWPAYLVPALLVWGGAYAGGIHPTLSGVLVAMLTPVRAWHDREEFAQAAVAHVEGARRAADDRERWHHLDHLASLRVESVAPADRMLHRLHGWVAFGIMPIFALANAGVPLGSASFSGDGLAVFAGVALGLVLGKVVGIVSFSWLAVRLGLAALPTGARWPGIGVVGALGGIGFTMSLLIASLGLPSGPTLESAKLAVLAGSLSAALLAWALARFALVSANRAERAQDSASR
jgi:NhaA family Na+:H+ antiporter